MNIIKMLFFLVVLTFPSQVFASTASETDTIPESLLNWKSWVLHNEEERFCPFLYNNGDLYRCQWPSILEISLNSEGGQFAQQWQIYKEGWVPLPGKKEQWPINVTADMNRVPVIGKSGIPSVFLNPGKHLIEGSFEWKEIPEILQIPYASGLVNLSINEQKIDFPLIDSKGNLWVHKKEDPAAQKDRMEIKIYRLINDQIPMEVTTLIKINMSGQAREINLLGTLLRDFIPMTIQSPIPARLSADGEHLMVQARPGRWEIRVKGRSISSIKSIRPFTRMPYGEEIWSFQSQNHLRMVKVEGVNQVDPSRVDIPPEWKRFPAYIIGAGDQIIFKEVRRGNPDPVPDQLHLRRTWWLDFDGNGFTLQDKINGTMSSQWYLAMNSPGILGRVSVDGTDQLITRQGKDGKPGVELRKGRLNLAADSRFEESTKEIPAVGWDHDFQSVSGFLILPPGWRLLASRGIDDIPGSWFSQWTLLDIFLVLIIALAIYKLWNWRLGILALIVMAGIYHEPGAPRLVWLNILAATTLLKFLPKGWLRRIVTLWSVGAFVTLFALSIPFMVKQIRWGIYPQIEPHRQIDQLSKRQAVTTDGEMMLDATSPVEERRTARTSTGALKEKVKPYSKKDYEQRSYEPMTMQSQAFMGQDPKAIIQTGPGLPQWKWQSFKMIWNGPVDRSQEIRLWLLSPSLNLILAICKVILLAFLIFMIIDFRKWEIPNMHLGSSVIVIICLLLTSNIIPGLIPTAIGGDSTQHQYPPNNLLEELKTRLLEKPDCLPNCADSPNMKLTINPDEIHIVTQVHAAIETAVPLPGSLELWRPDQVFLNSRPATSLLRDKEGLLWILVTEGIHNITLSGKPPAGNSFQIPIPLKPHNVTIQSKGWDISGIREDGIVEGAIQITREEKKTGVDNSQAPMTLPPFLHVERVISLGLNWQVWTTVRRVTPIGTPIIISVPLLHGESITTEGITVENGYAHVNMGPKARVIRWTSSFKNNDEIRLRAPGDVPWTETWILDASPIWHCSLGGITVVHHQDQSGQWRPQWHPWSGEEVVIRVNRPEAIPGQSVTIDGSKLKFIPGKRFDRAELSLTVRSSQGEQHKILLPENAHLQGVNINGKSQPIRENGQEIIVPLRPGRQSVDVEWHQVSDSAVLKKSPKVIIGDHAVNAEVTFQMPRNRWILFTKGPVLGPAVLFWTYLFVVVIASVGLGRITWTPLKTRHWLLLGLGLTQVHPLIAIMIVGWLLALGARKKTSMPEGWFSFNAGQIILAAWTVAALIGLYAAIQKGLLGIPDMQISGNGSNNFWLHWTQDRIGPMMPDIWVFSLPLLVFRFLILLWALWLAYALLNWIRWGWKCFGEGGMWKKIGFLKKEIDIDLSEEISLKEE